MCKIFIDRNHVQNVLERMRESLDFDVTLIAGDTEELKIPAHRFVLSASTDYFNTMFMPPYSESTAREVKLPHIDGETLKSLVDFCYSGRLEIREAIVEKLIVAADSLLLDAVVRACSNYISQKLKLENCLYTMHLADRHNFASLFKNAKDYCLKNFFKVSKTDEFLDLRQLLASDYLCESHVFDSYQPGFDSAIEEHVFQSVMKWLKHDPLEREQNKDDLLKLVRMPLMEPSVLVNSVQPFCTSTVSQQWVAKAMEWHSLSESSKLNVKLAKPRYRINEQCLMATTKGSELGILYHNIRGEDFSWMLWSGKLENRNLFDIAIIEYELFIVGGFKLEGSCIPLNTVICLNLSTMTLSDVKPMSEHRQNVSVAALKGFLYAVGGHDGKNYLSSVEKYDKETNTWSEVGPMSDNRKDCCVAILNEKLYVVGGCNESGCSRLAKFYDPQENVWTKIASLSEEACSGASVTVAGGILYLVGGCDYKVIQMYDLKTDEWVMLGRLPVEDINVPIWTFEDKVMVCDEHQYMEFDPIENEWKKYKDICKLINGHRVFSYSGELEHSDEHWDELRVYQDSSSDSYGYINSEYSEYDW